jgi:hypothetical protein
VKHRAGGREPAVLLAGCGVSFSWSDLARAFPVGIHKVRDGVRVVARHLPLWMERTFCSPGRRTPDAPDTPASVRTTPTRTPAAIRNRSQNRSERCTSDGFQRQQQPAAGDEDPSHRSRLVARSLSLTIIRSSIGELTVMGWACPLMWWRRGALGIRGSHASKEALVAAIRRMTPQNQPRRGCREARSPSTMPRLAPRRGPYDHLDLQFAHSRSGTFDNPIVHQRHS